MMHRSISRLVALRASLLAFCLLVGPRVVVAQEAPASHPPITWCTVRAPDPVWGRQVAYAELLAFPDSAKRLLLSDQQTAVILGAIATHFAAAQGLARRPGATGREPLDTLPPGEPRYGPLALATSLAFRLRGSGRVDSVFLPTDFFRGADFDTTLARDLAAAITAAGAAGELGPFADSSRFTMLWMPVTGQRHPRMSGWPAFTVEAPIYHAPRAWPNNKPIVYPPDYRDWKAQLRFEFVVDTTGFVVPGSVRDAVPPDSLPAGVRERGAYREFARAVERVIYSWRYDPAESLGCRTREHVLQRFDFEVAPRH